MRCHEPGLKRRYEFAELAVEGGLSSMLNDSLLALVRARAAWR